MSTRVDTDTAVAVTEGDLVALLTRPDWRELVSTASGPRVSLDSVELAPLVRPPKTVCVGLNYRAHILEMARELPQYPTLFAKFPDALTGPHDDLLLPRSSKAVDWEAELGVVIGSVARDVDEPEARDCIAGYTVVNDISMRDWQWRTSQWLQGKTFEASTPVGPVLVTPDEIDHARDLEVACEVDGERVQCARTSDLLFSPAAIVSYVSRITTLRPGDLIATGTPGGVGAGRTPPMFLQPGQTVVARVEHIGACVNRCVAPEAS